MTTALLQRPADNGQLPAQVNQAKAERSIRKKMKHNLTISLVSVVNNQPVEVARFSNALGCGVAYAAAGVLAKDAAIQIWNHWGKPQARLIDTVTTKETV